MQLEILVFEIEGQQFAVPSADAVEVLRAATASPLPQAPPNIDGVLNIRGRVVPLFDTRGMLDLPQREMRHTDHLIIVRAEDQQIMLRVDRAIDLIHLESDDATAAESGAGENLVRHVAKTSMGLIYVIDTKRLLSANDMSSLVGVLAQHSATEVTA